MPEGEVLRLLVACGVGGVLGGVSASGSESYGGAHFFAVFAAIAAFAAWTSSVSFGWLELAAPIAFAYGAAAIAISIKRNDRR